MCKTYISAIGYVSKTFLQNKDPIEFKHQKIQANMNTGATGQVKIKNDIDSFLCGPPKVGSHLFLITIYDLFF